MTENTFIDIGQPSVGYAQPPLLYLPRVVPLERPVGALSSFAGMLRNPLRMLPAAVYEEEMVFGRRAGRPICWVTEPSLIKTVLLDRNDIFQRTHSTQRVLGPLLGNGIFTADGADWKWQRRTAAPVFRYSDVLSFVPTIAGAAERLLADWREGANGLVRDIERDMTLVTFDVISRTLLPDGDAHVMPLIANSTFDSEKPLRWQVAYAIFGLPSWMPYPAKRRMESVTRRLRSSLAALVAERRASPTVKDDLLQRLANAKDPENGVQMSDELLIDKLLIDNLLTFFLAGHETTAKALTWTLYLLARAPYWENQIREEIRRVAGDGPIKSEHIDKLVITTQVLKESMRLYPPLPAALRQPIVDTELAGVPIKSGTVVVVPIYAIQRHRRYWSDPDRFDPARFAQENETKMSRYHYMPFGAGARICIGMAFALVEAITILATLVRTASFATKPGHEPEPLHRATLRPSGGMSLTVRIR
jgi:cytochrome P450